MEIFSQSISGSFSLFVYALLFFTGLCAGFVDSIAGGGGLISLPVLLSVGLPPQIALGTNKLQGSFGTLTAAYNYIRKGEAQLKDARMGIILTFGGAVAGAWTVQQLEAAFIKHLIPFLLSGVLAYTFYSAKLGYENRKATISENLFYLIFGVGLGFYDGFFGPGTGSFWTAAYVILLGFNMTKAAGYTRLMNFVSNIVALCVFIASGNVLYSLGICMASGQMIGARLGSDMAIQKGAPLIRPIFMTVVFLTLVRLVYVNYITGE
jgi:uncharacterized membrane protein YfcA